MGIVHKKKKLFVCEHSNITISYQITPEQLRCQCGKNKQFALCDHLKYYFLQHLKINQYYLQLLNIPMIIEWLQNHTMDGEHINKYCYDYLCTEECEICLQPYLMAKAQDLCQCCGCKQLYHNKCMIRWNGSCPHCRHGKMIRVE